MDSLLELFVQVDDFCQVFMPAMEQQLLQSGQRQRTRQRSLSISEDQYNVTRWKRIMRFSIPQIVNQRVDQFSGRAWLLPVLQAWLESEVSAQLFLLTGNPGTGKSMVMAWLVTTNEQEDKSLIAHMEINKQIAAVHFCQHEDISSVTPLGFADGMANQLVQNIPGFSEALTEALAPHGVKINIHQTVGEVGSGASVTGLEIKQLNLAGLSDTDSFDISFVQPLQKLYANGYQEPMLLLVDGLDEAWTGNERGQALVRALSQLAGLPKQVKILATSRPDPRVLKQFRRIEPFDLVKNAPEDENDIFDFARDWLMERQQVKEALADRVAKRLSEAAAGIFLYAYMVLRDIIPTLALTDLAEEFALPKGLSGLYHDFLTREVGQDEERWHEELKPLLGLIAVGQGEGLTRSQLRSLLGHDPTKNLRICRQYLTGELNEGPFKLFHQSLADYLLEDEDNADYEIDLIEMHGLVAEAFQSETDWEKLDLYHIKHMAPHLIGAGRQEELASFLLDFNYLQAKLDQTNINELTQDFAYLRTENPKSPERLLEGAMHLSANVLAFDKNQLAGHLFGRLTGIYEEKIQELLKQVDSWQGGIWLRPMNACLTPPGGPLIRTFRIDPPVQKTPGLAITADGKYLLSASRDSVKLWNIDTGELIQKLTGDWFVEAIDMTPDGQLIAFVTHWRDQDFIRVWDRQENEIFAVELPSQSQSDVWDISISDDGSRLFVAFYEGRCVDVWNIKSKERVNSSYGGKHYRVVTIQNGRKALQVNHDGFYTRIFVWDLEEDSLKPIFIGGSTNHCRAIAITSDGRLALTPGDDPNIVKVWNVLAGKEISVLRGHKYGIQAIAVTNDHRFAVSGGFDEKIIVWDLIKGQAIQEITGFSESVYRLAISENGQRVFSVTRDGKIDVWNLKHIKTFKDSRQHKGSINSIAFSADGKLAVTASNDKTLKVWDVEARRNIHTLFGHIMSVTSVSVSADGRLAVSGSDDSTVKVWNLVTGREIKTLRGHLEEINDVAITPDGKIALSAAGKEVKVWDVGQSIEVRTLKEESEVASKIESVFVTSDGKTAFTSASLNVLYYRKWNLVTGQSEILGNNIYSKKFGATDDGSYMFFAGGTNVYEVHKAPKILTVFDTFTNQIVSEIEGQWEYQNDVAIISDGDYAVAMSRDTLDVWKASKKSTIASYKIDENYFFSCCAITATPTLTVLAGDTFGNLHWLELKGNNIGNTTLKRG